MCNESTNILINAIFHLIFFRRFRKKPFDKIVDALKGIERPTMYDLGLEFLRIYDGRFNYREGHVVRIRLPL